MQGLYYHDLWVIEHRYVRVSFYYQGDSRHLRYDEPRHFGDQVTMSSPTLPFLLPNRGGRTNNLCKEVSFWNVLTTTDRSCGLLQVFFTPPKGHFFQRSSCVQLVVSQPIRVMTLMNIRGV